VEEPLISCCTPHVKQVHGGWQKCHPGHHYGPNFRGTYILHYIKKGKGVFQVKGKSYQLSAGEVFCIFPGVLVYYKADETDPWEYEWIGFASDDLAAFLAARGLSAEVPVFTAKEEFVSALERFLAVYDGEAPAQTLLTARAYDVLHSLTNEKAPQNNAPHGLRYINRAKDYLWYFQHENITVSQLATYLGIDRSYLTALFKKHLGVSPKEYITNLKMNQACRYLLDTEYSISQVANALGYEELFVFSRAFKKVKGVSPSAYRKSMQRENTADET